MELPQSRALRAQVGAEAGRKPTHDFLSLYGNSPARQDPRPSQEGYLKTHDFLQPLEREERRVSIEENLLQINVEQSSPPVLPPSAEKLLLGGTGTYSTSHISYFNQGVQKQPEGNVLTVASPSSNDRNDDNSLCSSYTGSGLTLWDESTSRRKEKVGKENFGDVNVVKEPTDNLTQWADRMSESYSNHRNSFSSLASSQPSAQKSQSFTEMIKSAKAPHAKEEDDDDEFFVKNRSSSLKGELQVKVDGRSSDQKANTPRSKHSETEQRRRCKINDRFQLLRELIPYNDQKRDKASFLLEVIEYIQFLQEKVHRYEGSHPEWNHKPAKLTPWAVDQQVGIRNKAVSVPVQMQADILAPIRHNSTAMEPITTLASDADNKSLPRYQLSQSRPCASDINFPSDEMKEQEMAVEGGTISISSMYSQGLLNTLTQALRSSGVDLSQASISVQVDIGKRANNRQRAQKPLDKNDLHSTNWAMLHAEGESISNEPNQAAKKLKTSKS